MTATQKRAQTMASRYLTAAQIEQIKNRQNRTTAPTAPKGVVRPQKAQKIDWTERPASDAQIARIHRCERSLGYRLSTRATIGNAGSASKLYQSLKAELNAL